MRRRSRTSGLQTRGCVVAVGITDRLDDQVAVAILVNIVGRIGIGFGLAVTPSAAAEIVIPIGGIRRAAGRPIELVVPDEFPAAGGLR